MNRFDFYPGDFLADTTNSTPEELGIYVRLLCAYYRSEHPIVESRRYRDACAVSPEEQRATDQVLARYFKRTQRVIPGFGEEAVTVFEHDRVEREIAKARPRIAAARNNGIKGGRPTKTQLVPETEPSENPVGIPIGIPERKLPSPSPVVVVVDDAAPERRASGRLITEADIPCPDDLALSAADATNFQMIGWSKEFIDRGTILAKATFRGQDHRTRGAWSSSLVKALSGWWSDPARRAEVLGNAPAQGRPGQRGARVERQPATPKTTAQLNDKYQIQEIS